MGRDDAGGRWVTVAEVVGELSGGGEGGRKVWARVEGATVEVALGELVEGVAEGENWGKRVGGRCGSGGRGGVGGVLE